MRTRDINKEASIREKAIELIVQEGLDGFSMQKLAKAAGVSPATLYIYYKDREDLILKLATEVTIESMECSLKGMYPKMPFAEGMEVQWKNRLAYYLEHPDEIEFIEQIRYTPLYEKIMKTVKDRYQDILGSFATNAINRGELMPLPFEVFWCIAYSPLYQLIKFHMQGKSHRNERFVITDEIIELTLKLVLKALKP
jgi:AcrR family transcriptional regulator